MLLNLKAAVLTIVSKYSGTPDDTGTLVQLDARAFMGILFSFLMLMDRILEWTNLDSVALMDNFFVNTVSVC